MAKVLLVEDDNNLREIYEARLQAEGYEIVSAHDGEEALVMAKQSKPDLIISDVMMPKISGFEMLDILRNTDGLKDVKVIMLTALGQNEDQQRADRLGADRYLVKSQVTLEDIVAVARQLLTGSDGSTPATPAPAATPTPTAPPTTAPAVPPNPPQPSAPPAPTHPPATPTTPQSFVSTPAPTPTPSTPPAPVPAATLATPAPEPAPVPSTPPAATAAVNAADSAGAESENDEAASVETQIENFVAGASSDPTTPPASDSPTPIPAADSASPAVPSTPPAAAPSNSEPVIIAPAAAPPAAPTQTSASDDKLISDAVDTFVANTGGENSTPPAAPASPASPAPETAAPATPQIVVTGSVAPRPTAEGETSVNSSGPSPLMNAPDNGRKKVISPLATEPKPDLNALLAAETAREQGMTPAAVIAPQPEPAAPAPTPPPDTPPAAPAGPAPFDPNSIAL